VPALCRDHNQGRLDNDGTAYGKLRIADRQLTSPLTRLAVEQISHPSKPTDDMSIGRLAKFLPQLNPKRLSGLGSF
jgi:hypothetical protein